MQHRSNGDIKNVGPRSSNGRREEAMVISRMLVQGALLAEEKKQW